MGLGRRLPEENLPMAHMIGAYAFQAARSLVLNAQGMSSYTPRVPLSQRQLMDYLGSDKSAMVRSIDDLEALELCIRKPDEHDRRAHAVELTARGKEVYDQTCGTCHQQTKFVGQEFVESWNDRRVYDFYSLVRGTMPLDNPGGLKEQDYLDVVAYLLQANHHASPKPDSLRADTASMRRTKIAVRLP